MPRLTFRCNLNLLVSALFWFFGLVSSHAQLVESTEWLVQRSEQRILGQFRDNSGWPGPEIPKGQAVVYVHLEGASYKVLAIGPVTSDAKAYARTLNDWKERQGLKGTVLYSQEKDCVAALYSVSEAGIGKKGFALKIPLASIISDIQLEARTYHGFTTRGTFDLPKELPQPIYLFKNNDRFWDLSNWSVPTDVVISRRLAPWVPAYVVFVLVFPPFAAAACYLLLFRFTTDLTRSLQQRRQAYNQLLIGGSIGANVIHWSLLIHATQSGILDNFTYLWFNTSSLIPGMISISATLLMPFMLWKPISTASISVSRLSEDELQKVDLPLSTQAQAKPEAGVALIKLLAPLFCALIVGIGLLQLPAKKMDPFEPWKTPIALALVLACVVYFVISASKPVQSEAEDLPILAEKAERVVEKANALIKPSLSTIYVLPSGPLSQHCVINGTNLHIAESAVRNWTEEELLYYVLYRKWYMPPDAITNPYFYFLSLPSILGAFAFLTFSAPVLSGPDYRFLILVVPITAAIVSTEQAKRKAIHRTFYADLRVVRATEDPTSAITALTKMDIASQVGLEAGTKKRKPLFTERIDHIRTAFPASTDGKAGYSTDDRT